MTSYLIFIGTMNVLGAGLLLGALSEPFADGLLRRWTAIIPPETPFRYGPYGRIWLWWATIGTGFFGVINLVAAGWPVEFARAIVYGNIYAYGSFELLAVAASWSGRYGKGINVSHALWIGQAGWGVATVL